MNRTRVMHITDTLEAGGAERVAVNIANLLQRERYRVHFCTTRWEGPLGELLAADIGRLNLARRQRFDLEGLWRLVDYIRQHRIQLLHAHGTSLFSAVVASFFPPRPAVVWHVHFGRHAIEERPAWVYRLAVQYAGGVISVSQPLAEWSRSKLRVPARRVWYIPNFVCDSRVNDAVPDLPGEATRRIICVANLRPEKDHLTLLRAMALVIKQIPDAHLLLVGKTSDPAYYNLLKEEIVSCGLERHVSLLGERRDVPAILRACDIGVLSSVSEGFPLALIEYGMAGLPAIATRVGQCAEVLDEGRTGLLVQPREPQQLAEALLSLLQSPERAKQLGQQFRRRVLAIYSAERVMEQICSVYDTVLGSKIPGVE